MDYLSYFIFFVTRPFVRSFVDVFFRDFWRFRDFVRHHKSIFLEQIYYEYLRFYGSWIGIDAEFDGKPIFPHNMFGIFISNRAHIGKNVVIFHHVTIGSNTLRGHAKFGGPTIGDSVYLGCGAKIIGKIVIGENVRIGANCVCVNDVPANSVVVIGGIKTIVKTESLDNTFI